ncbi:hypothetical protein OIO90_006111 [Microbotryomycetes sp. JL221]|nr:hypothetical protein OIO90_006111 [Microbotryomycetes sp. JL221]
MARSAVLDEMLVTLADVKQAARDLAKFIDTKAQEMTEHEKVVNELKARRDEAYDEYQRLNRLAEVAEKAFQKAARANDKAADGYDHAFEAHSQSKKRDIHLEESYNALCSRYELLDKIRRSFVRLRDAWTQIEEIPRSKLAAKLKEAYRIFSAPTQRDKLSDIDRLLQKVTYELDTELDCGSARASASATRPERLSTPESGAQERPPLSRVGRQHRYYTASGVPVVDLRAAQARSDKFLKQHTIERSNVDRVAKRMQLIRTVVTALRAESVEASMSFHRSSQNVDYTQEALTDVELQIKKLQDRERSMRSELAKVKQNHVKNSEKSTAAANQLAQAEARAALDLSQLNYELEQCAQLAHRDGVEFEAAQNVATRLELVHRCLAALQVKMSSETGRESSFDAQGHDIVNDLMLVRQLETTCVGSDGDGMTVPALLQLTEDATKADQILDRVCKALGVSRSGAPGSIDRRLHRSNANLLKKVDGVAWRVDQPKRHRDGTSRRQLRADDKEKCEPK